ncbi:cell division protein FtsK [Actinomadura sp. KC216]|uniref:FtsK/SpoIIIE domain-containing protein n=1 Tax=Actinomadura sp. KC216 TaxID=2530370 RepID=UPI0010495ECC|nr:FtsK/SpoIIIE domain-containing protein [Actinomadura sp. KC216]TDB79668.1 cell division protein FtsK [Actinomadura sp. KC216]
MNPMDQHTADDDSGEGTVVPLRPAADYPGDDITAADPVTGEAIGDASGDGPDDGPGGGGYAPVGDDDEQRRPIVPEEWTRETWRTTLADLAGLWWYKTRYHGFRAPKYIVVTTWYAVCGARRLSRRLMAWWQWTDGWVLESQAVAAGRSGHHDAMNAHREGKKTRAARGQIVALGTVGAAVAGLVAWKYLPGWAWIGLGTVAAPVLARHGAPEGQPIIRAAVVPTAYQTPTPEIITRGLGSLGISAINQVIKSGEGLAFIADVHRDGDGWGVELDLPHGVTATHILQKREELASGLRRPLSATWPERLAHEHAGRLYLWIGRRDISKAKPVPYPLVRTGTTDVFATVPFAVTPRGQLVGAPLFEYNWVIGAAPGQGKTTGVRALGCGIALDVVSDLWIHELAGKGDLEPLSQVCHRYVSGMDDEAIAYAAASVRKLKAEMHRRSEIFKKLPREAKPDGKLTRELAADRRRNLRPIGVIFDEVQNLILHPDHGGPALVEDLAAVERIGRAYGIFIIFATQRPDGDALPPKVRDLALVRFCLKVPDHVSNDMILGSGAYKAGYRASEFRLDVDRGLGWYNGAGDMQAVRTLYLDLHDTARIAARARAMRQAAGVLSGYALGEAEPDEPERSFAADVLTVFGSADKRHCDTIAALLREHLSGVYADITTKAVSSQLRALGIEVKKLRDPDSPGVKAGCERAAVYVAAHPDAPAEM